MNKELERKDRYEKLCMEYVLRFCEKHDLNFDGWVGDRVGETAEIGDMYLDFSDIRFDIDTEQKVGKIEKWWDYTYDLAMLECPKTINFRSWCAGAPVPYSQRGNGQAGIGGLTEWWRLLTGRTTMPC